MKKIIKKDNGITLIALVTTIVILLILSGITIGALTKPNGLIGEANQNSQSAQKESIIEKIEADLYSEKTITGKTPGMSKLIEISEKYGKKKETENILEIEGTDYTINFNEINGWTEYYIYEAKNNGTVYDKNKQLEDSFGNTVIVPKGFKISSDSAENVTEGVVIEDATYTNTIGSEFVWIPVGIPWKSDSSKTIKLGRYEFKNATDSTGGEIVQSKKNGTELTILGTSRVFIEEELREVENKNAVAKNINTFISKANETGGFWIGRYEARVEGYTSVETSNSSDLPSWTGYKDGKLVEKPRAQVFNYITQNKASELSRGMYSANDCFESDLINSYAWDTATLFLQEYDNRTGNDLKKYSIQNSINTSSIKMNGTVLDENKDKICNVYDMASNCLEWTTETACMSSPCVKRGGRCGDSNSYTSIRGVFNNNYCDAAGSFRPILYVK